MAFLGFVPEVIYCFCRSGGGAIGIVGRDFEKGAKGGRCSRGAVLLFIDLVLAVIVWRVLYRHTLSLDRNIVLARSNCLKVNFGSRLRIIERHLYHLLVVDSLALKAGLTFEPEAEVKACASFFLIALRRTAPFLLA